MRVSVGLVVRVVALFALLLTCCAAPELTAEERNAGAAAIETWRASALPEPDGGRCDVHAFRVRVDSEDRFLGDCGALPAYGCTRFESTDEWFRYRDVPVVVIAPWWKSEPSIIVHELMHAYVRCSGIGPSAWDAGDSQHTDARVWEVAGGASSVQARAMQLLTGHP